MKSRHWQHITTAAAFCSWKLQNAAAVVMCCQCLDFTIRQQHYEDALRQLQLPGRFQRLSGQPCQVVLDVAHNPAAVRALRDNLRTLPRGGQCLAVCGMMADKPAADMAAVLAEEIDAWFVGSLKDPRGAAVTQLARDIRAGIAERVPVREFDAGVVAAYRAAVAQARKEDWIVVFGSFLTVGGILASL